MPALPEDPFSDDLVTGLGALDDRIEPLNRAERLELVNDLSELMVFQTLLEPKGVKGVVVDCGDCATLHYHNWDLLRASLQRLLDDGMLSRHEPACNPDPDDYVSWEYCRGYAAAAKDHEFSRWLS